MQVSGLSPCCGWGKLALSTPFLPPLQLPKYPNTKPQIHKREGSPFLGSLLRVVGVGAGIWFVTSHPQLGPATDRNWLAAAVIATVLAWTTGVVVVASRQRVPIYDIHDQG